MDGYFNANDEPAIRIDVGPCEIEFLVDTGFTGGLIIPDGLAKDLDIKSGGALEEFYSATGEPILISSYSMEIDWLGQKIRTAVATSSQVREAILGGHMLREC